MSQQFTPLQHPAYSWPGSWEELQAAEEQRQDLSNKLWWGGGLLLGGGVAFLVLRSLVRKARYKNAIGKTDDVSSPENIAQRFVQAFNPDSPFGWGTDEELIRRTIQKVPHQKAWEEVKRAYQKLTKGGNLLDDMQQELSRSEKREMDLIISALPPNQRAADQTDPKQITPQQLSMWAERIQAAANYEASAIWPYGTDEQAIYAVLEEVPTGRGIYQLDQTYRGLFQKGLLKELTDEMSGSELAHAYQIIVNKPDVHDKKLTSVFSS